MNHVTGPAGFKLVKVPASASAALLAFEAAEPGSAALLVPDAASAPASPGGSASLLLLGLDDLLKGHGLVINFHLNIQLIN